MVKGLVVSSEDTRPITVGDFEEFEDYRKVVDGYTEHIDIERLGITVCINGEGLLQKLPFNSRATFLWWYHVPEARQRAILVGNAVIVGLPDAHGAATDVPEELVILFTTDGTFHVEIQWDENDRWANYGFDFETYFEALIWAMLISERVDAAQIKVVSRMQDLGAPE